MAGRVGRGVAFALLAFMVTGWRAHARAYSYASPLGDGCHEAISAAALREVRADVAAAAALPANSDDRAWIDDLPLDLPDDMRDLAGASLIVGVRDNDLKGHHGLDNSELSQVHGDPAGQREHCLRGTEHDEPDGSERALRDCRAYVREQVQSALERGFDAQGRPDRDTRMKVRVYLAFAGSQNIPALRAWLQLGRALHALQDSFSHTLRSPDGLRVRGVLNWIDLANDRLVPSRDGPAHRRALDECVEVSGLRALRRDRAIEASAALLRAALEPAGSERVEAVLERYLSFEPGCDASNDFCDAPELAFAGDALACSVRPGRSAGAGPAFALAWLAFALWLRARPTRTSGDRRPRRSRAGVASAAGAALLLLAHGAADAGLARAQEQAACGPLAPLVPNPDASPFALEGSFGGSLDETALAVALGGRYRISDRWLLGLDVEWNPWASIEAERVRPGSLNTYASVIWRWLLLPGLALRTTGHVGVSTLLFDLYGAPAGSVGPYLGISLLALELPLGRDVRLLIEPADVRVPIPHLGAIPLSHRQYRATVGVELWL
jgi:hypothetical protein